jgi:threonine dehydratase
MPMQSIQFNDIEDAYKRISPIVQKTPIVQSALLNTWLGHNIYFKAECLQTTGAFKLRGASNFISKLAEAGTLPKRIVANSSGNHAQAVAYAANHFNIPVTIYSTKNISNVKAAASEYYGASLRLFDTRTEADQAVLEASQDIGTVWIPPFNHPDIIAGQGTVALEALNQVTHVNAVFAPCGGGGLVSSSHICAKAIDSNIQVVGVEPLAANDAAESIRKGEIVTLDGPPKTMADGAATPSVGEHTFPTIKLLDDFFEINENDIAYWTQWLQHLLKLHVEPTCAMTMQGVINWLIKLNSSSNERLEPQHILVLISGGNISAKNMQDVWRIDHLDNPPSLF